MFGIFGGMLDESGSRVAVCLDLRAYSEVDRSTSKVIPARRRRSSCRLIGFGTRIVRLCLVLLIAESELLGQPQEVPRQAAELLQKGQYESARAVLEDYVRQHSRDAQAYFLLGAALSELGRWQASNQSLRRALELDRSLVPPWRFLGVNAFETKNFEEARRCFQHY